MYEPKLNFQKVKKMIKFGLRILYRISELCSNNCDFNDEFVRHETIRPYNRDNFEMSRIFDLRISI